MAQVSDYDIANASGAAVRADINLVLDAIKTLNSGSGDPSNAVPFMLYGDTSDNILKVRNSGNSGFTEIGNINQANLGLLPKDGSSPMSGALKLSDGSQSSPALSFDNDTDLGLFRNSSNEIAISCAGNTHFKFGVDGLAIMSVSSNTKALILPDADNSHHIAIRAPNTISTSYGFTLPTAVVNGGFLQTDSGGNLSFAAIQGVPTGTIFCFPVATVPTGYLECNGDAVPNGTGVIQGITADFSALRALIGANLPDLRGEFVRGWASNRAVDSGRSIGSFQSAENEIHNHSAVGTVSAHRHTYAFAQGSNGGIGNDFAGSGIQSLGQQGGRLAELEQSGGNDGQDLRGYTATTSSTQPTTSITIHNEGGENRPRNVALMYIIKF